MAYYLIIFLLILIVTELYVRKNIFSPTIIFNFIWFIILFLYEFKLSYIQQDLSSKTLFIFFVAIISFNLSSLFISFYKKINHNDIRIDKKNNSQKSKFLKSKKIVRRIESLCYQKIKSI